MLQNLQGDWTRWRAELIIITLWNERNISHETTLKSMDQGLQYNSGIDGIPFLTPGKFTNTLQLYHVKLEPNRGKKVLKIPSIQRSKCTNAKPIHKYASSLEKSLILLDYFQVVFLSRTKTSCFKIISAFFFLLISPLTNRKCH